MQSIIGLSRPSEVLLAVSFVIKAFIVQKINYAEIQIKQV